MKFTKESRINASPSEVFAFHESPGALLRLTPPWEKIRLVEGGNSLLPGSKAVIEMKLGIFSLRWVAEHTEYRKGEMFADRQVSGPFSSWYHVHRCLDDWNGGTILRDEIDFSPPLGSLGRFFGEGVIKKKLNRMFDYRHEQTKRIVEAKDFDSPD